MAWAYEKNGWYKKAQNLYDKLVSRGVVESGVKLGLARCMVKNRQYEGVPELLGPDVMPDLKGPQAVEANSVLGRAFLRLGEPEMAVRNLNLAVTQRPEGQEAARDYHDMGMAYDQLKQPMQAMGALEQASAILKQDNSATGKALHYLVAMDGGAIARKARRVDKSSGFFELAVQTAPSSAEKGLALYSLAQVKRQENDLKSAQTIWTELAKLRVEPWSGMAARHLADQQLAPSLAQVGK